MMRKYVLAVLAVAALLFGVAVVQPAQADPTNTYIVNDSFSYAATGTEIAYTLDCNSGDVVSGGGFRLTSTLSTIRLMSSTPDLDRSGWIVSVVNNAGSATDVEIYAVCES